MKALLIVGFVFWYWRLLANKDSIAAGALTAATVAFFLAGKAVLDALRWAL